MAKCSNCGQETARTEDWSCQWCGYPLVSGSYKKIPRTYRELKEERLPQQPTVEEVEPEAAPVLEAESEPVLEPEPKPVLETDPEAELEPEVALEPAAKPKPRAKRKPAAKSKSAPKSKRTTKSKSAAKAESTPEAEVEPELALAPAAMELTIEELTSAYIAEGEAANARFANQILRITGVVERIEVKETLGIYYFTLNSAEENLLLQSVRCVFDKIDEPELSQLAIGETVTVQGKYDGSIIDLSLRDCVLAC
ncbi:hypothetical protein ACFLTO_04840 [Chloroflexota bacterium]